jgi:hypothetical protein
MGAPERGSGAAGAVKVFEHDRGLLAGLDREAAAEARAVAVAPTIMVDVGRWTPPRADRCGRLLGLLVLEGLMTRCTEVDDVQCPDLVGAGDLLRPWDDDDGERIDVRVTTSWTVLQPVRLAVLDARFVEALRRWPWIVNALMSRAVQRSNSMALRMAIPQIRRADDRIRMLFRDLADRWGRVTPEGTLVPLPLTNQLIAQLVCLRRPTVSSTMGRLAEDGEIVRRADGFLLAAPPPAAAAPASAE